MAGPKVLLLCPPPLGPVEDGLHLQADQQKILGEKVAELVKDILG